MSEHLRRKVEHWICAHLSAVVPSLVCVPSDGDTGLLPPYAVAVADEENAETVGDMTSVMPVDIIYATHSQDTPSAEHAAQYRAIQLAMRSMPVGDFPELGLIISGAQQPVGEVSGQSVDGEQAHGDVVSLTVAATDMGTPLSGAELVALGTGRTFCTLLGDGAALTFTVAHNLACAALDAIVLREAAADGRVLDGGRDYRITLTDANTLTIVLTDGSTAPGASALVLCLIPAR